MVQPDQPKKKRKSNFGAVIRLFVSYLFALLSSLSVSTHGRKRTSPTQEPIQNQPPLKKVIKSNVTPILDLSNEDLSAEATENSENLDPNVQAGRENSENVDPNIQAGREKASKSKVEQKIKPPPSAAFLQTTSSDEEETPIKGNHA